MTITQKDRIKALRAMDAIVEATEDEDYIEIWAMNGVPDGTETDEDYAELTDTETFYGIAKEFGELMQMFIKHHSI